MSRKVRNNNLAREQSTDYDKVIKSIASMSFSELNSLGEAIPTILNSKLQASLASDDVEKAIEAGLYVEKQRIRSTEQNKSIFFLPDSIAYSGRGYKETLSRISFQTLQRMGNLYCVKNVISTRIEQVTRFLKFSNDEQKEGFTIRKKKSLFDSGEDRGKMTKGERKRVERIVEFLEKGGETDKWEMSDSFVTFVRKIMQDSLSIDQLAFEITRTRGQELHQFKAIDGSMIRFLDTIDPNYASQFERYRYKGYLPKYCQVFDQQIVFNKQLGTYVMYYPWELGFGVRNVGTDIWQNGYGRSELESLIEIITYILNGVQYNGNFFKNGSNPKGFIKMNGPNTNQTQLNDFKQKWRQMLTGTENAHKIPIFAGIDMEWVDLHHCLHPDSKVWTKNGQFTLGEILGNNSESLCEIWDGLRFSRSRVFKTGRKKLCETGFLNRCSIKTSPDHRFLVLRGDEPEWVHQKDLIVGDFVFVNKKETDSEFKDLFFNDKPVDTDLFELFGWILGDGYIGDGKPSHKFFSLFYHPDKENDVIYRHINICNKYGINVRYNRQKPSKNNSVESRHEFYPRLIICDHLLYDFFRSLGFTTSKEGKSIPKVIYALKPVYRKAILRGLFSADGYVGFASRGRHIELTVTSPKLKSNVIDLLLSLGIRSNSFIEKKYEGQLSPNGDRRLLIKDKDLFMSEIGFIQSYKIASYLKRERSPYVMDEAPVSFIKSFATKLRLFYRELDKNDQFLTKTERHDLQNISSGNQKASLSKVLFYAEKMNYPIPCFLKDFNLTKVTSLKISDDDAEMVDVEMFNESHQFIANGIVVHNSNRDMEFDNWTKFLIVLLCSVYRIDPSELGFQFREAANVFGQDGQKARLDHSRQKGLYPLLIFLQDIINKFIVSELDEEMEFAFTGIEVEDEEKQVKLDADKLSAGMVSMQDMFRKYSGREFDENKDIILNQVYQTQKQMSMYGGEGMNQMVDEQTGEPEAGIANPFEEVERSMASNPIFEKACEFIDKSFNDEGER